MATDVVMPQMGESLAEGTVTKWLKNVGDKVERDEPLFEISTDKVDSVIPAPAAGVLHRDQGARGHDREHQHRRRRDRRAAGRGGGGCAGARGTRSAARRLHPAGAAPRACRATRARSGSTSRRSRSPSSITHGGNGGTASQPAPAAVQAQSAGGHGRGAPRRARSPDVGPRAHLAAGQDHGARRERRPAHRARHRARAGA